MCRLFIQLPPPFFVFCLGDTFFPLKIIFFLFSFRIGSSDTGFEYEKIRRPIVSENMEAYFEHLILISLVFLKKVFLFLIFILSFCITLYQI